jgi:hypothetical protein
MASSKSDRTPCCLNLSLRLVARSLSHYEQLGSSGGCSPSATRWSSTASSMSDRMPCCSNLSWRL